jgi:glycosyltransferase involved in cell wall biosynthesis
MNIVFFMQDTGSIFGAERATLDLAAGLREAGEQPRFFMIVEQRRALSSSALQQAIEKDGFPVHLFPVSGRISRSMAKAVRRKFSDVKGDVLHVIGYKANVHAWLSGIRPVVATVHGWLFRNDLKERMYDRIDRWCLRRCDQVICLSSYYENFLRESGVKPDRLKRIPSGLREIPSAQDLTRGGASSVPVFGMMGRFSEEKNHAMFVRAASMVHASNPDVRFLIAGQGPLENSIKQMVRHEGLADAVEFCGYMDVATFMKRIDVYVICSKIENLPYSILEAMAWAKPVIGTSVGGIPDLVLDGKTGCRVKSEDAQELSTVINEFVADPEKARAMGRAGRERIEQEFVLTKCVAEHRCQYQSLLRS